MRPLALALSPLLLLAASPAHAVLITGRAQGTITFNGTAPGAYQFTPGEVVSVTFAYDPALSTTDGLPPGTPTRASYYVRPGTFRVTTGGGYDRSGGPDIPSFRAAGFGSVTNGPTDIFLLELGSGSLNITLTFTDPTGTALSSTALPTLAELLRFTGGTLDFNREGRVDEIFGSTVVPVADFPVPEPSTLALGAIGIGVLGLAGMRRRRGAGATRRRDRGDDD